MSEVINTITGLAIVMAIIAVGLRVENLTESNNDIAMAIYECVIAKEQ